MTGAAEARAVPLDLTATGTGLVTVALATAEVAAFFATGLIALIGSDLAFATGAFPATGMGFFATSLVLALVGADLALPTDFFTAILWVGGVAAALAGLDLTGALRVGFLLALTTGLVTAFTGFLAADGAAATLVSFWTADALVLAVFLAGDFTSALLLGPENSRSWVLTPEDGGMDSQVDAGVFIPRLDEAPSEALFVDVGGDCNDGAKDA